MTRLVTKTVLFSILFTTLALAPVSGCSDDDGGGNDNTAVCGNNVCDEGETAIRCPEDCGCGNGVINLVEDCDGENLGGNTCETVGYNGGVLSCAADCTFAVNRCCENQCDNFGDSRCDRTTVRQTCATRLNGCLGWEDAEDCIDNAQTCDDSSGTAVCTSECDDLCPGEGDTRCSLTVDTAIEQCVMQAYGCLNWEDEGTDCADTDDMCVDTTGAAYCCSDECTNIGQTKCTGRRIEVCDVGSMGCNEWLLDTQCPQMETCEDSGGGPQCVPIVSGDGEDCSDAWVLVEGQNTVNWVATLNNYLTSTPSCTSSAPDGPDVVLMYPASVDGHLDIWMDKPASTRYVMVVSDGLCGDLTSQVTCVSEYTATTMGSTFPITAGETYYFYIVDTTSGTNPLPNPINMYVTEIDCSTTTAGIVTLTPSHDATEVSSNSNLIVDFDQPVKSNLGVVTVTGSISTNLSYDLSTSPSEVSFSNGNRRMTIDPAPLFQLTETITVTWTGMEDSLCNNPVSSPTWNFQVRATADPGENCANPIPLSAGSGSYGWLGSAADYITVRPCGTTGTITGPDVVGSFTASATGYATISWQKPASNRMIMAVYEGNCGDFSVQLGCVNDYTPTTLEFDFIITGGQTYWIYWIDTTSGTQPLPNPLDITITETDCGPAPPAVASNMSPANGATTSSMSPTLSVDFDKPVLTTAGVITLTGNISTNLSYDLATSPSQVTFTNLNQTMNINPGIAFPAGENITVSWTNLRDAECGKDIPVPTWTFTIVTPPCSPGSGGMVGTTLSSISTGLASMSEYYVAADTDANGYVYVGSTSTLYRLPKAGGALQNVATLASLTTSHLGYAMLINGNDIFVVNESITTSGVLWRISTTGGTTWTIQDYVSFPSTPTGDIRGVYHYSGKIYMVTHGSTTLNTQIWSVNDTSAVLPVTAVLEGSVTGEGDCSGIAVDDDYIYLACGSSERVVRLARAAAPNFTSTLLFNNWDMSSTANDIWAVDTDTDGVADILYVHGWYEEVYFVCEPDGVAYYDMLVSHGGSSSSYGMGFDRVANALWVFDDDVRDFTKVQ